MSNLIEFDVQCADFQRDPYTMYARLHRDDAVLIDPRFGAYFIGGYADVHRILTSPGFTTEPLAKRAEPVMGDRVLAQMKGPEHDAKRKAVLSGLTGRLFRERYGPMIQRISEDLLAPRLALGQLDLVNQFGKEYGVLVTLGVLGLPTDRYKELATWHVGVVDFVTSLSMSDEERRFSLECSRNLIDYLTPIVSHCLATPDEGLISMLCKAAPDGQQMSVSEVVALVLNVLLAATEPADKTLALLFKHLLDNPAQFERVKANRELLGAAIDETLRLTSPVQLIPRQTEVDMQLSGIDIPKGSVIFCLIGAANRDPAVFNSPDTFQIDRQKSSGHLPLGKIAHHLAFGAGMHVCVGAAFSLLQIELTANLLLDKLNDIRFAPGFVYREQGLYTRGPSALCIEFSATGASTPEIVEVTEVAVL